MQTRISRIRLRTAAFGIASCSALLAAATSVHAAEGYRLRQAPVGGFGGEIAAPLDNPGLFGTAILTQAQIYKVADGRLPSIPSRPLAGPYSISFPAGSIDSIRQNQTQLNLIGGYMTESTWADGRWAFAVNLPLIHQSRSFDASQPLGTVSPTPVPPAVAAGAAAANAAVQAQVAALEANNNTSVTGVGDAELSAVWIRHRDRLKVAAGISLFVPTGKYDKTRGPNPGYGNFYTVRPGVAVTYALNPDQRSADWDSGVTLAGRVSYGYNTTNNDTDWRSGNFVYLEAGAIKVTGNWGFGANLLSTRQVTDDSGSGALLGANRYSTYGYGVFAAYRIPGKDSGFNLQYSDNFGGQNAQVTRALQLRFIKAW